MPPFKHAIALPPHIDTAPRHDTLRLTRSIHRLIETRLMSAAALRLCAGTVIVAMAATCLLSPPTNAADVSLELQKLEFRSRYEPRDKDPDFLLRATHSQFYYINTGDKNRRRQEPDFQPLVKKEPQYKSEHQFHEVAKFGSDHYPFVFDAANLESDGFDLLYFDANRNGDLTDDPVIKALPKSSRSRGLREFPRVDITVNADGRKVDYAFFITASHSSYSGRETDYYDYASLYAAAYRQTDLVLDGKSHRIVLVDFNSNGRFDDEFRVDPNARYADDRVYARSGDVVLVDPDSSVRTQLGYGVTQRKERHPVSKLICINNRFYELTVPPAGDKISLTPLETPLGAVTNPNGPYEALLYNDKGVVKIVGEKSKPVPLPAGDWQLVRYTINRTSRKSILNVLFNTEPGPTFVSATATTKYPIVELSDGKTTGLPFGPPYKPTVKAFRMRANSDQTASLELQIKGSAGELCTDMEINGSRPGKPSFEIKTPKGKVIKRNKFKFG